MIQSKKQRRVEFDGINAALFFPSKQCAKIHHFFLQNNCAVIVKAGKIKYNKATTAPRA